MPPKSSHLGRGRINLQHRCGYCGKSLPTAQGLKLHTQQSENCRRAWEASILSKALEPPAAVESAPPSDSEMDIPATEDLDSAPLDDPAAVPQEPNDGHPYRTRIEEVPDEEEIARWVRRYPGRAAEVVGMGENTFEKWRRENAEEGRSRWYPFASEKEWGLARWLVKSVGQNDIEDFLKLPIVSVRRFRMIQRTYQGCGTCIRLETSI